MSEVKEQIAVEIPTAQMNRYQILSKPLKAFCLVMWTLGCGLFMLFVFGWSIRGWVLEDVQYYYLLFLCFSTTVFLLMPIRKTAKHRAKVPWYDFIPGPIIFGIFAYFAANAWHIAHRGWVPAPNTLAIVLAIIIGLMGIEAGRRLAGWPFCIICLVCGVYPLFAEHMPGILFGFSFSFPHLISSYAFGKQGLLGLPAQTAGSVFIGFLLFAGVLIASGAGRFFLNVALGLLGTFRGGPAKVAVFGSGLFASVTAGGMLNMLATGCVTIPAMKRVGYTAHYAGAIETVASMGGAITPPVMGVIAFIMAVLTDIPYSTIIIAAAVPALLYYWGLMAQVDAYAARVGLRGMSREEIPSLRKTLKEGWHFVLVLVFLVFGLVYMRWGAIAPIYATGLMVVLTFVRRETWLTPRRMHEVMQTIGGLVTYMMAILMPVGFIMIGLQVTGSLTAITAQLVTIGGQNPIVVLLIAVTVCYLMGMIGITLIPYIVLAVTVIPALVASTGLNLLGLHLFIVYFLLMAGITPPVAIAAFIGAGIAGAPPMKTAWTSMRLAAVLYFVPFFFVFNPALILQGSIVETLYLFALCLLGIGILAGGLEGYLLKVGRLSLWSRPLLVAGGFLIALPGWVTTIYGVVLTAVIIAIILIGRKAVAGKVITNS